MTNSSELIDRMIRSLQVRKSGTMADTLRDLAEYLEVSTDTLYKWRAHIRPNTAMVARLVEFGVLQAGMDATWAAELLIENQHPDSFDILTRLFPISELPVRNNLPAKPYKQLIGRDDNLEEISKRLNPRDPRVLIPIEGVGGIGTSAVALEAAWLSLKDSLTLPEGRRFEAIVWITAKSKMLLTRGGIVSIQPALGGPEDLYQTIGEVLQDPDLLTDPNINTALKALARKKRVLLVIDDVEDLENLELQSFLRQIPFPNKVILTLHYHEDLPEPIRLSVLNDEDMAAVVRQESEARGMKLDDQQVASAVSWAQGMPLAAPIAASLINLQGGSVGEHEAPDVSSSRLVDKSQVMTYIFEKPRQQLRDAYPDALRAWFVLSFFDASAGATLEMLADVLGFDQDRCRRAMFQLYVLNLVTPTQGNGPYTMLGFTHRYCRTEVAKEPWGADYRLRWADLNVTFAHTCDAAMSSSAYDERATTSETNQQWHNLRQLYAWCEETSKDTVTSKALAAKAREFLTQLWSSPSIILCAEVLGYWPESLKYLTWLAEGPGHRDPLLRLHAKSQLGRLYALKEDCLRAEEEISYVESRHDQTDAAFHCLIVLNRVMLDLRHHEVGEPGPPTDHIRHLLESIKPLLDDAHPDVRLNPVERAQLAMRWRYYEAKLAFVQHDDRIAARLFWAMVESCVRHPALRRMASYGYRYLAQIALRADHPDLEAASEHLSAGLVIAHEYQDALQIMRLNELLVNVAKRQGNEEEARSATNEVESKREALGIAG